MPSDSSSDTKEFSYEAQDGEDMKMGKSQAEGSIDLSEQCNY
jgi:hypothetical protein